jgi:Ser/Thr protein kinase RdoA (MazF antagonist)
VKTTDAATEETLLLVAQAALRAYDLPRQLSVQPIRLLNNAVFEVVGEGVHLALRIHRPSYRSISHIRSELSVLQVFADELRGSSVSVPLPFPSRNGDVMVCVGDRGQQGGLPRRYCDLLTWIDGRVLKHERGLGTRSTFLLGESLGRLHNAAQRLADDLDLPRWDAETVLSDASPFRPGRMEEFLGPEAWNVFQDVAGRTRAVFNQLGRDSGQWGIIHNDYILINCHFKRGRQGWKLSGSRLRRPLLGLFPLRPRSTPRQPIRLAGRIQPTSASVSRRLQERASATHWAGAAPAAADGGTTRSIAYLARG